jgi:hypothetical protein
MPSPAETLTAAADRVRDLAAKAQRGPWIYNDADDRVMVDATEHSVICYSGADYHDARWIAALSPAVAPMIATMLRGAAETCEQAAREGWSDVKMRADADEAMKAAFALAERILGSGVDTP